MSILCEKKISFSAEINGPEVLTVSCDLYKGHPGTHHRMFYKMKQSEGKTEPSPVRLGFISWHVELAK